MQRNLEFRVDRAEIRRYLGYQPGVTEDWPAVDALIEEAIARVSEVAKPRGLAQTYPLQRTEAGSLLVGATGISLESADLSRLLHISTEVSLFVATIGAGLDQLVSDLLQHGRHALASVVDAVGSDAAEQTVNQLHEQLAEEACATGQVLTTRFSPGYGDLPLSLQAALLGVLAAERIGVTLTSQQLMLPRKSITALVGWQAAGQPNNKQPSCSQCVLQSCQFRRAKPINQLEVKVQA